MDIVKEQKGIYPYIFYQFFSVIAVFFWSTGVKFIAYDLTQSNSFVSLVGSVSGVSFLLFGTFSGIIVSATSNRFFIKLFLITFIIVSVILYTLYHFNVLWIGVLFLAIFVKDILTSFSNAANGRAFYDLCGTERLSFWISRRGMLLNVGTVISYIVLYFLVDKSAELFLVYAGFLACALLMFEKSGYQDSNKREDLKSTREAVIFVYQKLKQFIAFSWQHKIIRSYLALAFGKTLFLYWPMSVGVLLKLGISDAEGRKLYIILMILMDLLSVAAFYFAGKRKTFGLKGFVVGAGISGLGVLTFAFSTHFYLDVITLSFMYLGLTLSGIASSFVLRSHLPDEYLTQGLSFSVIPYYFADIVAGTIISVLLLFLSVKTVLLFSGIILIALCFAIYPLVSKIHAEYDS